MSRKVCSLTCAVGLAVLSLWILGEALSGDGPQALSVEAEGPMQKGMSYVAWWHDLYSLPEADLALEELADAGAGWISLIVTWYQDDVDSTDIYSDLQRTPSDAGLVHAITRAHALGLQVMLKPHLDLANDPNPDHWRGLIGQDFTATEWNEWFASYQTFIDHYAQLAQTQEVEQFCVGTELSVSQAQAARWRAVVTGVRSLYGGTLTYAANWDDPDLAWWDAVDYIGIDAYYPLTDMCDPTVEELVAGWAPHVADLWALAGRWEKEVLITEIGYRSVDCAVTRPYDWEMDGPLDLQEQADAYQVTLQSLFHQPWLAGLYWWAWETNPFQGGPCDDGYSPHDKPAEDVLRRWYGAAPRPQRPALAPDAGRVLDIYTDSLAPGWENWSWDATVDLASSSPVQSGTHAISVTALGYGALSLYHEAFASDAYYWLELYVQRSSAEQRLEVYFWDASGQELRKIRLDDCRYTGGIVAQPMSWTHVLVPLDDLGAAEKQLTRLAIRNSQDEAAAFALDEVRLVGALRLVYLPLVARERP